MLFYTGKASCKRGFFMPFCSVSEPALSSMYNAHITKTTAGKRLYGTCPRRKACGQLMCCFFHCSLLCGNKKASLGKLFYWYMFNPGERVRLHLLRPRHHLRGRYRYHPLHHYRLPRRLFPGCPRRQYPHPHHRTRLVLL